MFIIQKLSGYITRHTDTNKVFVCSPKRLHYTNWYANGW